MPVSVIVGGQYGSEGKGKVVHHLAQHEDVVAAVRVGGPNSGHSVVVEGREWRFRALSTAALVPHVISVVPPGAYLNVSVLLEEVARLKLEPDRLIIDPRAYVISAADVADERGLRQRIGSTQSGVGAAVARRARRRDDGPLAGAVPELQPFLQETQPLLRSMLDRGQRVVVEGTQGFGLSVWHGREYPKATARDTSAAGALSESGLSPLDVDEVVLVLRAFPIRVAGDSGSLPQEIDWETIAREGALSHDPTEWTTVTKLVRRVARFDSRIVRAAMHVNTPTTLVLNHLDLVSGRADAEGARRRRRFVEDVEERVGQQIDLVGTGPAHLWPRGAVSDSAPETSQPLAG